jgi:hypothetical protein
MYGTHQIDREILSKFQESGEEVDFSNIRLHLPSNRIQQAAIKQYQYLVKKLGYPPSDAQAFATWTIINQAGFGKFGSRKIGRSTNRELLVTLAGIKRLLPMRKQRTLLKKGRKR